MNDRTAVDLLEEQEPTIVSLASSLIASPRRDGTALRRLVLAVLAHIAIKEAIVHPAARRVLDIDFTAYLEHHTRARNAVAHLATRPASVSATKLKELRSIILDHFALERRELFPALLAALTPQELTRLAEGIRAHRGALAARVAA